MTRDPDTERARCRSSTTEDAGDCNECRIERLRLWRTVLLVVVAVARLLRSL